MRIQRTGLNIIYKRELIDQLQLEHTSFYRVSIGLCTDFMLALMERFAENDRVIV